VKADLPSAVGLVLTLALAGGPAGLLWWWLAPRAEFRITADGPVAFGNPSEELLVADDAVYALVLAAAGLVAGGVVWLLRRRRGVATVLALAVGASLTAVVAWQVGELLGPGPSEAEIAEVGARVTTGLTLASFPALAIAPFTALLAYVVAVLTVSDDGLGRLEPEPGRRAEQPLPDGERPVADGRPLVDVPPPGRPSA
jgi:hypothetical protein